MCGALVSTASCKKGGGAYGNGTHDTGSGCNGLGLTYVVKSRALATLLSVVALGVVVVALVMLFVYAVGSLP